MQVLQACKTTIDVAKDNLSKMDKNIYLLLRLNCIYDSVLVNPFQNS